MGHFVIFIKIDCEALTGRTSTRKCKQLKSQNYVFFCVCCFFFCCFVFFAFCRRCWPCQQCEMEQSLCVKSHILMIPYWTSFDFFSEGHCWATVFSTTWKVVKKKSRIRKKGSFLNCNAIPERKTKLYNELCCCILIFSPSFPFVSVFDNWLMRC